MRWDTYADTSRAAAVLGWTPKTRLAEGLREEVVWIERVKQAGGFPDG